ncbi:tRNA 2-thiouridine(34) synthase MnmA [Zymomonas mobilis subsp. mobilis ZM4 = ATCC 31821]|uniref:tRNA-specific 2-thiouridylase MnmA n=2 Tax=Zymomonas mobilis subsp. mobilis TaxID=120045 RepID=MNMA_ZYMMO|nr:tRNA 2-thiouridine(34) synthase MnmA [Zymomonas mobilis]Q5NPG7.2 RecName: Full=tRNA-specific 2-thiouridylase MnmA [Zymomonas mobilis subsp. mobilis ZM4 = ATCC 31821]AAV89393.2 tRNA (5-methylaminomethyl-2-thiouridylate)-methyltransferase [Zymomonas mobilis subsp. mobilis ZM4 = ATCC 31821]AEH62365.1 tRNA (5-methylaminomethyl-2-thiouridylate)-methyltransferase [Zymomonas mobilis subsp. mobilis ATCC 10988]ART93008.1 tRNA 2-thiouridine(34) synthase MnmA [Zymomonas mobilis subsp. mobilis]AVZ25706
MSIDFQIDKPKSAQRIVVAMSGGVDSSVVAALAKATGAETIGITLQLYDHGAAVGRKGSCCAGKDIRDARAVAEKIGIPHYVFDYENNFKESVIDDFVSEYVAGRTPVPCIRCNQGVKFTDLLNVARELGADCLATGHYVRRLVNNDRVEMHRALDPARDQSYFLFATTKEQLDYLRFPLGGLPKPKVREMAAELGLSVAMKADSQDICFVPDGDYARIVEEKCPESGQGGDIVDMQGRVLGKHSGLIHFTVGQRRGLEIGGQKEPLYVIRLDPAKKQLVVGPRQALAVAKAEIKEVNWLVDGFDREMQVKIRSAAKPVSARFDGKELVFEKPEYGVSPGQAAVFYDGDQVLGGGWIKETTPAVFDDLAE